MTTERINLVRVQIKHIQGGWFVATSDDFPNLLAANSQLGRMIDQLPSLIQALIKAEYDRDVRVEYAPSPAQPQPVDLSNFSFVAIPIEAPAQSNAGS